MAYKLTKGSVAVIRQDSAGVKQAETAGYILDGECDEEGNLLPPRPIEVSLPKKTGKAGK
jgi:hypothetical protein